MALRGLSRKIRVASSPSGIAGRTLKGGAAQTFEQVGWTTAVEGSPGSEASQRGFSQTSASSSGWNSIGSPCAWTRGARCRSHDSLHPHSMPLSTCPSEGIAGPGTCIRAYRGCTSPCGDGRKRGGGESECHSHLQRYSCSTAMLQGLPPSVLQKPGNGSGTMGYSSHQQKRHHASMKPPDVVYSGPKSPSGKRTTLRTLRQKYLKNEPITMVTAYDYPSAVHVDNAGVDILLVGDSVAMVVHGHDTTLPVTLDDMILHCKAVSRGSNRAFLVGDLPFGSYEASTEAAIRSAVRIMKEGTMDAVKMEGGGKARVAAAKATVEAGVAVMGHVGLMPQAISVLGGFRPQGQSGQSALRVMQEARDLQEAGCFAVVLECVPALVAKAITVELEIPTIGIGAGAHTSGQVLVYHDLLGMMQHPHYVKVTPKFCKQYASLGLVIQDALRQYTEDVSTRAFPTGQYSPYSISPEEERQFLEALRGAGNLQRAAQIVEEDLESRLSPAGQPDPSSSS